MKIEDLNLIVDQIETDDHINIDVEAITNSYNFLKDFSDDKIIYGINTGFGPMAQYKIEKDQLKDLQYNLIRSHANGMGSSLCASFTKALMIARFNSLNQGFSGVSLELMQTLEAFIKNGVRPFIPKHGGVGASGDLVQLAHLGLCLIGEGFCIENEEKVETAKLLQSKGIKPLELKLRDGLALINGTSCMTGIASVNIARAEKLTQASIRISAILNEITDSYGDSFSEELNAAKKHKGQSIVAEKMRTYLADSGLLKSRKEELYSAEKNQNESVFKNKVQEYYSLRCVPQIVGPILDTINFTKEIVENELNSTSDNPIIDYRNQFVYHGGNFHGDYISLEMDKLKIAITKLTMLMERQLNYLLNTKINEKFPAFLNSEVLGLNFGLQGIQFAATSTTAENQTLSNPMSVHSIPCNNDNQDIVSMGTNSALIASKIIENAFEVLSILQVATVKACGFIDRTKLSTTSKELINELSFLNLEELRDRSIATELEQLKYKLIHG